jgi:3-mercaptopyruvate sulfurtransferase SseA
MELLKLQGRFKAIQQENQVSVFHNSLKEEKKWVSYCNSVVSACLICRRANPAKTL